MKQGSIVELKIGNRIGTVLDIRDNGQVEVRLLSGSTVIANKNMFKEVSMEETNNASQEDL